MHASFPHAVSAGNVETSQRIVDVVFRALAKALPDIIPAAGQGTMNNVAFGGLRQQDGSPYAYYETIGGGMGAGPRNVGQSGIHVHMSNTLNTPIEALEHAYPLQVTEYALRKNSGGIGKNKGGDGIIREIKFLEQAELTLVGDRKVYEPYGLKGGKNGKVAKNFLIRKNKKKRLATKVQLDIQAGDIIRIETPGGGAWGKK